MALYNPAVSFYNQAMSTSHTQTSSLTRGYAIALAGAAILSTTAIFIRYLTQTYHMPALILAFWRDLFVVVTLLVILLIFRPGLLRVETRQIGYLVIFGFVLSIFNSVWTLSVALNGAAVSTVLAYSSVAFTALLGWWFLRERLGWAKIFAVLLCLAGCLLVSGVLQQSALQANLMGILVGVLTGLAYAVYSLMGRSASQRGLNAWTILLYAFGFASVFLLIYNLIPGGFLPGAAARPADLFWLGSAAGGWAILFLLAAVPSLLGFGLYMTSLGMLPSSVANLIATTEPVWTAMIAYILLGERMTGLQIGGSLMILAGVFS